MNQDQRLNVIDQGELVTTFESYWWVVVLVAALVAVAAAAALVLLRRKRGAGGAEGGAAGASSAAPTESRRSRWRRSRAEARDRRNAAAPPLRHEQHDASFAPAPHQDRPTATEHPPRHKGEGDLLGALARFWWVVAVAVCLGALAGAAWATYSPQQYSSRVTLVVELPDGGADTEALVRTVEALILSNVVVADIVEESDAGLSATEVEDRLTVERPSGSAVIEVEVKDTSASQVEAIAAQVVPALDEAIDGLQDPIGEGTAKPSIDVTSFQDNPEVLAVDRLPKRDAALGGLAGLILGLLVVALLSGRRDQRSAGA